MALMKLVNGFRVFKANYIAGNSANLFDKLVTDGQSPEVLVIACSDSRIDPAILTNSEPGDLFSVRNVAAMVPTHDADGHAHGTSAAIEYAVMALKVKYIIVMGHALCGGIRALAESSDKLEGNDDFISRWISISIEARDKVREIMPNAPIEDQARALEQASIIVSMQNLMSFPSIRDQVEKGELQIHGWYFDMPNGKLLNYDPETMRFRNILAGNAMPAVAPSFCGCEDTLLSLTHFLNTVKDSHGMTVEETLVAKKAEKKRRRRMMDWLRGAGYALGGGLAVVAVYELGAFALKMF